jgi:hypothetical protein
MPREQGSGPSVAGLVLGIVSIPAALIAPCGFVFAVLGIILAAIGRRAPEHRTLATYGLVLSCIGMLLAVANVPSFVNLLATHPGVFTGP